MTKIILERAGYCVLPATSPKEALEVVRQFTGRIHLLVTDVIMPGMNGRDLAQQVQALHPAIKLVFMSGYTANVIAHHGVLDSGVNFIQKPFSISAIAGKLREVLDAE